MPHEAIPGIYQPGAPVTSGSGCSAEYVHFPPIRHSRPLSSAPRQDLERIVSWNRVFGMVLIVAIIGADGYGHY